MNEPGTSRKVSSMHRLALVLAAALLGPGIASAQEATQSPEGTPETRYVVTDLPYLLPDHDSTRARGINDAGQVVGSSRTQLGPASRGSAVLWAPAG